MEINKKKLESFVNKINNFNSLDKTKKTDLFVYFLEKEEKNDWVSKDEVSRCYEVLKLSPQNNMSQYIANNYTQRYENQKLKFIKKKSGFVLERNYEIELSKLIGDYIEIPISDRLFPFDIVKNTRQYIEKVAEQSIKAYETGLFDASLIMLRKLFEILIIELYERFKIESEIKNENDNYFFLSDLINKLLSKKDWNLSRNIKESLPKIKISADLSAHNRNFIAGKSDIEKVQMDIRVIIQELIHKIDYPNWNKEIKK